MGEYLVVLFTVVLCLVTTSTCENESKGPCRLIGKVSGLEKTKQGIFLQGAYVNCVLMSQESEVKFTFDINWALDTAEVDNNTLVDVGVLFWCLSSIELDFINPQNTAKKNILLGLSFKGFCKVWTRNLAVFAKATDFRAMGLEGEKATWSSESAFTNVTQGNNSLVHDFRGIAVVKLYNSLPENIPGMFTDTKNVWPNMAEMDIKGTTMKEIPEQWKITMPFLQRLLLVKCNLTKPPEFPWNNSTLEFYRELRRDDHPGLNLFQVQSNLYVRALYLDKNNIKDLTSHEFRGFLHFVSLRENGLKVIGSSCFRNLEGIQTIDLGENNLASLPRNLFQGLPSLLNILLGSNNLTAIEQTLFKGLNNIKLITIDHNNLHSIPNGLFSSLNTLEVLNLGANNIAKIEENPFPKDSALQKLYLDKNKLSSFPPWLFLLRNVKVIDLSSNQLTFEDLDKALDDYIISQDDPLENGEPPIVLNLSNNNITTLVDSDGLSRIKQDEKISPVRQAKYTYLWKAYVISFSGNPLVCDCIMSAVALEIGKLLQKYPSIRSRFETWQCHWPLELKNKSILEIREDQWLRRETELEDRNCPTECTCRERCSSGIIVVDCEKKKLTEVPSLMPQGLIELNLMSNDIRDIPAFPYLVNVTVLKLTNNKVERLKASTVEKLKRVKILLIDVNKLTTLPREIESLNFTTLALEQNLLKCDCRTKWMKNWLVKNRRRIRNIDKVFCNSEHVLGQAIYSLPDDEFICTTIKEKNTGQTVPIETVAACTLGGLLALMLIIAIVLYKYHREVKVFMYTHFNWHPFDRIDDSDPNKIYDAFISFSGNDFDWVKNTLQERLENHDTPYKLCFHHRDFPVGEPIVENIFKSVDQSKRMLVVLSSSYAKSDWCLMEFREAHRKVLEDRMKYLIVILFDDVDTTELDEEFKLYLRTNTYLSVSDKGFWQKLYYAMPLPSTTESVEDRSLESVASSGNIDTSTEILQQEALEMAHNTIDTIALVQQ